MRVHLVSNVCNNHYVIAKYLRRLGVDAHLFYPEWGDLQMQPESEDPEIKANRPDWLHPYGPAQLGRAAHVSIPEPFRKELFACDVLHVHDLLPLLWAADSGRPYVWHPFGTDIYNLPFLHGYDHADAGTPDWLVSAMGCRDAIARSSAVITEWWFDAWRTGYALLQQMGMMSRIAYIPHIAINTDRFSPTDERTALRRELCARHGIPMGEELLLFHPTRQMISSKSSAYFANERLYEALGNLRRRGLNFRLVVVEKGCVDEPLAKSIIERAGISGAVTWVPMMPRHQLVDWYRAADLTVAELTGGSVGAVGFEAMACGCPLVGNFYVELKDPLFWPPPIVPPMLNVQNQADIESQIWDAAHRPEALRDLGCRGRAWVLEHMTAESIARQCLQVYERVIEEGPRRAAELPDTEYIVRNSALNEERNCLAAALDNPDAGFMPAERSGKAAMRLAVHFARAAAHARELAHAERLAWEQRDGSLSYHLRRALGLFAQKCGVGPRNERA